MLAHDSRSWRGRLHLRDAAERPPAPKGRLVEFVRLIFVTPVRSGGLHGGHPAPGPDHLQDPRVGGPGDGDRVRPGWRAGASDRDRRQNDGAGAPPGPGRPDRGRGRRPGRGPGRRGAAVRSGLPAPAARRLDQRRVRLRDTRLRRLPDRPDQARGAVRAEAPCRGRHRLDVRRRHQRVDRREDPRPGGDRVPLGRRARARRDATRAPDDRRLVRSATPGPRSSGPGRARRAEALAQRRDPPRRGGRRRRRRRGARPAGARARRVPGHRRSQPVEDRGGRRRPRPEPERSRRGVPSSRRDRRRDRGAPDQGGTRVRSGRGYLDDGTMVWSRRRASASARTRRSWFAT